MDKVALKS